MFSVDIMEQMIRMTEVAPAKNSIALVPKNCKTCLQMILTWWKVPGVASGCLNTDVGLAHKPEQDHPNTEELFH